MGTWCLFFSTRVQAYMRENSPASPCPGQCQRVGGLLGSEMDGCVDDA